MTFQKTLIALSAMSLVLACGTASGQDQAVPGAVPGGNENEQPVVAAAPMLPREMFSHVQIPANARPHRQSVSHIAMVPDIAGLSRLGVGSKAALNVTADSTLTITITKVEHRPDGSFSLRGIVDGVQGTSVMMSVVDDALAADITLPTLNLHYKTKYVADGVHLICNIDDMRYAPCAPTPQDDGGVGPEPDVPEAWEEATGGVPLDQIQPPFSTRGSCSPEVVFDAMIVYTDVARAAAGGTSAIQAECQLAIDRTNESYDNSPISARMRLVRRYEITYNEVGIYDDHLDRLTGTNGQGGAAPWTTTRTNRDTYNADFCSLWVDDGEYCGLAWCTSAANRGYSVVTWDCAAGNLSHPHEIGHNQGCGHDVANGGCGYSAYAYGWRFNGSNGVQYRTVMAYAPGSRIPYFSNPSQTYLGTATGTSTTADNERVIEERKDTCANFELTRWDIFVDEAYNNFPIPGIGTNDFPYSNLIQGITAVDDYVTGASEYPNLYLKSDYDTYTGTISKPMTIRACTGPKSIG